MSVVGFMARDNGRFRLPVDWDKCSSISLVDETKVTVLRSLLFFYTDQKITIGELRTFFTERTITTFENDGYIKIEKND